MGSVSPTERVRLEPGEHRAISVLTCDQTLLDLRWHSHLERLHIRLDLAAPEHLGRLGSGSDVVILPMTVSSASENLELVAQLTRGLTTPILLAIGRGCEEQAVEGLHLGAQAFMLLPYRRPTLVRHVRQLAAATPRRRSSVLQAGPVVLDVRRHEVTVNGLIAPMPAREFEILRLLLEHGGEVVATADIYRQLWGAEHDGSNTLAVHIRRLRERLEADPSRPSLIRTVRGVGYQLLAPAPVAVIG